MDIGDYIASNLVDVIGRIDGVGDVSVFGTGYAMRIWMNPALLEKFALMPSDITTALNAQNAQVSAGQLGALPALPGQQINASITARTKLKTAEEFENILLKVTPDGAAVLLKDVARVELGADNLGITLRLNGKPGAGMGIVLADGANATAVSDAVNAKLAELEPFFPNGLKAYISSDSTPFVRASIKEVLYALGEAILLVVLGGVGTVLGPVLGAVSLLLVEEVLKAITERWLLILGPLILIMVLVLRNGIAGLLAGKNDSDDGQGGAA